MIVIDFKTKMKKFNTCIPYVVLVMKFIKHIVLSKILALKAMSTIHLGGIGSMVGIIANLTQEKGQEHKINSPSMVVVRTFLPFPRTLPRSIAPRDSC